MKNLLPKLLQHSFKGQNGRLAIIGGCLEYTGAPYYSSLAQLKGGSDLAHIFCTNQAAIPIKSYSPEVITHPYMCSLNEQDNTKEFTQSEVTQKIQKSIKLVTEWQSALHSFVIGPGLGRDKWMEQYIGEIIAGFKNKQIIVLDADGLWYMTNEYVQAVKNQKQEENKGIIYQNIVGKDQMNHILTPNPAEFDRMWKCFMKKEKQIQKEVRFTKMEQFFNSYYQGRNQDQSKGMIHYIEVDNDESDVIVGEAVRMAKRLNGVNIIQKGMLDVVTNGTNTFLIAEKSSPKRCGGIGDILSGLAGLYCYWGQKNFLEQKQLQEENIQKGSSSDNRSYEEISLENSILNGCILSCSLTRKASYKAFQKYHLSLTAPNIIECIGASFQEIYNHYAEK